MMTSRLFNYGGSSSESESDSSNDDFKDQQVAPPPALKAPKVGPRPSQFSMFSDEEEESKRVVKSAKEKKSEELQSVIKLIKNSKRNNDFSSILDNFEELVRLFEKSRGVLLGKEVAGGGETPGFYIKCLADVETFVTKSWEDKEFRSRLNKNNNKSLVTLRQKLRKYNKDFEEEIETYRKNPVESGPEFSEGEEGEEASDEGGESGEGEEDVGVAFSQADIIRMKEMKKKRAEEEDSDELWSDDDASSISSVEVEKEGGFTNIAQFFLKKESKGDKAEVDRKEKMKEREAKRLARAKDKVKQLEQDIDYIAKKERPRIFAKEAEVSLEALMKKFEEVRAARGKKGTDKYEQIDIYKEMLQVAEASNLGPAVRSKLILSVIAAIVDLNTNVFDAMKLETFCTFLDYVQQLLAILRDNWSTLVLTLEMADDEKECLASPPYLVQGCALTIVMRLLEEFNKMLQDTDPHSTEYIDKLKLEPAVYEVVVGTQDYLEKVKAGPSLLCKAYLTRLEMIYYKFDHEGMKAKENGLPPPPNSPEKLIDTLAKYIYTQDKTNWIRTRAVLCHIFHHALHDRWFLARDLMLMSHLQENIQYADIETQILYNRTLVQLGLCGFRHGNIRAAHDALLDIQSSARSKELMAQGVMMMRNVEKTPEQEKMEKCRQRPFHMHISLELMECVYLTSAMLLEIPYMAAHERDTRRRMISKSFHHQLKQSERQPLPGPPENMREHVIAASKAMRAGDWNACANFIINEKMNAKVWDLFPRPDIVKDMLKRKIQEESLRTYLFTFSSVYDSISLDLLADMFELDKAAVHSIVSKMIITEELSASWDEPTNTIVTHLSDPSRLHNLSHQVSEKLNNLLEHNERLLEACSSKNILFFGPRGDKQGGGGGMHERYGGDRNQQQRGKTSRIK